MKYKTRYSLGKYKYSITELIDQRSGQLN